MTADILTVSNLKSTSSSVKRASSVSASLSPSKLLTVSPSLSGGETLGLVGEFGPERAPWPILPSACTSRPLDRSAFGVRICLPARVNVRETCRRRSRSFTRIPALR